MTAVPTWMVVLCSLGALASSPALHGLADWLRIGESSRAEHARWIPGLVLSGATVVAGVLATSLATFAALTLGSAVLVVVSIVDLAERRIPNLVTYPLIGVCLASALWSIVASSNESAASSAVVGGLGFWLVLLVLHIARPDAMGMGDVKLAFPLGYAIGWAIADGLATVAAIGWTLVAASMFGLGMAASRQTIGEGMRQRSVPFGPAMAMATSLTIAVSLS